MWAAACKHCCIDRPLKALLLLDEQKNCRREGIISPSARPCPNAFEKEVLHKKRSSKNLPLDLLKSNLLLLVSATLHFLWHVKNARSTESYCWCWQWFESSRTRMMLFFFWNIRMMLLPFPFPVHGDVRKRKKLKSQRETDSSWQCHHFELQQPAAPAL